MYMREKWDFTTNIFYHFIQINGYYRVRKSVCRKMNSLGILLIRAGDVDVGEWEVEEKVGETDSFALTSGAECNGNQEK